MFQQLIDEFFEVRHVVTGSLQEIKPILTSIQQTVDSIQGQLSLAFGNPRIGESEAASGEAVPPGAHTTPSPAQAALQVRVLTAKIGLLEEQERRHLDEKGQRLWEEIQQAVRELNLRQAIDAGPRLAAWLDDEGRKASARVRVRAHAFRGAPEEAKQVVAWAKRNSDLTTHRRCLLAFAQGALGRLQHSRPTAALLRPTNHLTGRSRAAGTSRARATEPAQSRSNLLGQLKGVLNLNIGSTPIHTHDSERAIVHVRPDDLSGRSFTERVHDPRPGLCDPRMQMVLEVCQGISISQVF